MHELVMTKPAHPETDMKPELVPSTIDKLVIKISRLSGYVFMAVTLGLIISFFI